MRPDKNIVGLWWNEAKQTFQNKCVSLFVNLQVVQASNCHLSFQIIFTTDLLNNFKMSTLYYNLK